MPFTEGPRPWLVLARNAVPVIGVLALGWPADLVVFEVWFDGVTAFAAMFFLMLTEFARREPEFPTVRHRGAGLVVGGIVGFAILGIPYWFVLGAFLAGVVEPHFWHETLRVPAVLWALTLVLVGNLVEEWLRGHDRLSDSALRREFDWEFHMHLGRVVVILMLTFLGARLMIVPLALALAYVEIYPMRSLRILGGDASLDPENEARSPD